MPSYRGYRFSPEIISHAVWLYHRFALSFRDVEDVLARRGVEVTYEAIRKWCRRFGPEYAGRLRRRRGRLGDTWHLDEVLSGIVKLLVKRCPNSEPDMLSREQLSTSTAWGLDTAGSLKLTIPCRAREGNRFRAA